VVADSRWPRRAHTGKQAADPAQQEYGHGDSARIRRAGLEFAIFLNVVEFLYRQTPDNKVPTANLTVDNPVRITKPPPICCISQVTVRTRHESSSQVIGKIQILFLLTIPQNRTQFHNANVLKTSLDLCAGLVGCSVWIRNRVTQNRILRYTSDVAVFVLSTHSPHILHICTISPPRPYGCNELYSFNLHVLPDANPLVQPN